MELLGEKTVKIQDAKFKIHENKSNETSIYIDNEIASNVNLVDGEEIVFIIEEENLLRALSFVFQFKKTLFKKEKIVLDHAWFNSEYNFIRKHFEIGNEYKCIVNNSKGRFYLNSLRQTSGLNIRNILIENYFVLEFLKDGEDVFLKLNYSDDEIGKSKVVDEISPSERTFFIEETYTNRFVFKTLKFLYELDKLEKIIHLFVKNKDVKYTSIKTDKNVLTSIFKTSSEPLPKEELSFDDGKPRFYETPLSENLLGEYFYLSTEWTDGKDSRLDLDNFCTIITEFYDDLFIYKYNGKNVLASFEIINEYQTLQKIYYGSPGTGKSRLIKKKTGNNWPRVTFHPELDYQGFVGAYKPTMKLIEDGGEKEEISYEYVPEAFVKAYCKAWGSNTPYYLIIEEINRGNCAQIFGDIFQLLDRDDDGYSEYPIECSPDLKRHLSKFFKEDFERKEEYEKRTGVTDFSKMALPNNLSILATMNTSDQSLFPMDSAFKRRWDWQYVPINYKDALDNLTIGIGKGYNWGEFIQKLNKEIKAHTESEDKLIGNRFVSPSDGIISEEQFVSKVLFYLWNEVYKEEQGSGNTIFMNEKGDELTFGDFFNDEGVINTNLVIQLLDRVTKNTDSKSKDESEEEETHDGK